MSYDFIIYLIFAIVVVVVLLSSDWLTHLSMMSDQPWNRFHGKGWGNYKKFKTEFNKYKWDYEGYDGDSLFDRNGNSQFHANIIKFNNIGMVMVTPLDLFLVKRFVKKYKKEVLGYKKNMMITHKW